MIYTVTLNPSIDYVIEVEDFILDKVNRIGKDDKFAGGKGINVSRVLSNLNIHSKALGFIGGFTGEFIKNSLDATENIETSFINVSEDTRINVKIKSKEETEINGQGPVICNASLQKFYSKLECLESDDVLVLSGNVQKSIPNDIYASIIRKYKAKGIKIVVDTTGESLLSSIKEKPFLIKPNKHELEEIFDTKLTNLKEIIFYGKKLIKMGCENLIISMAGEGALFINNKAVYLGKVPKGEVKNSVGAGDSMVAGFIAEYLKTRDFYNAFKFAIATGSATAFSKDLCTKDKAYELLSLIEVIKIS
ncbi:1-phosphofructokinase [Clostridium oceanicum]|uniref:Tagatose-6-phosphate kinase n=1 Tax=Clostridium oceanicum TaxID=1543 RepID=A0ABN1JUB2_9CLOT